MVLKGIHKTRNAARPPGRQDPSAYLGFYLLSGGWETVQDDDGAFRVIFMKPVKTSTIYGVDKPSKVLTALACAMPFPDVWHRAIDYLEWTDTSILRIAVKLGSEESQKVYRRYINSPAMKADERKKKNRPLP